jgi:hypothetical protein
MTALTHLVGNENDVPSDATPWGVWTFNENGVFLPISRRSAFLFLRDTRHRGAKAPGSAQNQSKTRSFMLHVNKP